MRYKSSTGQTTSLQPFTVEDVKQNPEIRKTRSILLILISIEFVIEIIDSVRSIIPGTSYDTVLDGEDSTTKSVGFVILVVSISLIYYIIFMTVLTKYKRIGILIFAWLNAIGLIIYLVIKFIEFAGIAAISSSTINRKFEATDIVIHSVVFIIDVLLSVLIIFFTFKLAKLIKRSRTNQMV